MERSISIVVTNAKTEILWVNNDFTHLTGYSSDETTGQKPGALLQGPKTKPADITRIRESLRKSQPFTDRILNYRKNGETYICQLAIHPIFNYRQQVVNYIAFEVEGDKVNDTYFQNFLANLEKRYQASSLRGAEEINLFLKLKRFLEIDKPYLDPNLSLREVADHLHSNTKYLSQVVNYISNHNFQFFINTFRINEAKRKLLDHHYQNLTLYGIALHCGFKNKSTFYKVFKEVSRMTPREFIMRQKQSSN